MSTHAFVAGPLVGGSVSIWRCTIVGGTCLISIGSGAIMMARTPISIGSHPIKIAQIPVVTARGTT